MMSANRTGRRGSGSARALLVACALLVFCLALSAAQAHAAEAPAIVNAEAQDMTEHGAKVELEISPHGAETTYEVWIECQRPSTETAGCDAVTGGPHEVSGTLPASSEAQPATVEISGLEPGYVYLYRVAASNAVGRAEERWQLSFETAAPGACSNGDCPYASSVPLWVLEAAGEEAERIVARIEAERQAARELEERIARERAAAIAAAEAAALAPSLAGAAGAPDLAPITHCIVPWLRGDTLRAARRALTRAHCRLGRVRRPRHYTGTLRVRQQSLARGAKLADDAAVAVTLKPQRHHS
jgi:hypothetical protein